MKNVLRNLLILTGFIVGLSLPAGAVIISSTTNVDGPLPVLLLRPGESLAFTLEGGFTGNLFIESSEDAVNYTSVGISSTNNTAGSIFSGNIFNGNRFAYFRWNVSTVTAGSPITTLADRDDFNREFRNLKGVPNLQLYDRGVRLPKGLIAAQSQNGSSISLSSMTAINEDDLTSLFNVITSTGAQILMGSVPTISTDTVVNGTIYIIQSSVASVIFQDNGTLTGSALELGAATRSLGVGDILMLIFRDGSWWEMGFHNN